MRSVVKNYVGLVRVSGRFGKRHDQLDIALTWCDMPLSNSRGGPSLL